MEEAKLDVEVGAYDGVVAYTEAVGCVQVVEKSEGPGHIVDNVEEPGYIVDNLEGPEHIVDNSKGDTAKGLGCSVYAEGIEGVEDSEGL